MISLLERFRPEIDRLEMDVGSVRRVDIQELADCARIIELSSKDYFIVNRV